MSRTVQPHQHSSCTPAMLSNPLNPATCLFSSNNNSCLYVRNFLCCRLPVGYKLFSTHRYLVFCSFADILSFSRMLTHGQLGFRVYLQHVDQSSMSQDIPISVYLTVGSCLFLSVLCCTYIVCPASQLIHPVFVSRQGHLEQLCLSVVLLAHSLCNINWRWETASL